MYEESYQAIRDDERNGDSEREQELRENYRLDEPVQEMHDINVETTYERAEREAMMADEVQANYEREDRLGMI